MYQGGFATYCYGIVTIRLPARIFASFPRYLFFRVIQLERVLIPRLLKSSWRRITDCLKRNRNHWLLQPAHHPRRICFA